LAHEFALLGSTPIAQSSRLSQIRHHLSNLNALEDKINATLFPDITRASNKMQKEARKRREVKRIRLPSEFSLDNLCQRLNS
jgi:hypothetical protein